MASTERLSYTQAIPAGASFTTDKGVRYAVWTDRGGRRVKARILEGQSGRCTRTVHGR